MRLTFDDPAWTLTLASIVPNPGSPPPQSVCRIQSASVDQNGQASRVLSGLTMGQSYRLFAKINWDAETNPSSRVQFRYNNQVRATLLKNENVTGVETRDLGSFVYDQVNRAFAVTRPDQGTGTVDVVEIFIGETPPSEGFEMSKRREIREKIVERVGAVLTGNGYALSIGEAVTGPVPSPGAINFWPHVGVHYGVESKEVDAFGTKQSTAMFELFVLCRKTEGIEPDDQCDDACGEIEKALEISRDDDGNTVAMLGLSYVTDVFVADISPTELPKTISLDIRCWRMDVAVTYTHDRRDP